MAVPITSKFFGIFTFMVMCFCVENFYIISAESKEDDVPESPPIDDINARMFYVSFTIEAPYQKDYSNSTSQQFQKLAEKIKKGLIKVCDSVSKNPLVSVKSLWKTSFPNQVHVIAEIATIQTKGDALENAISQQINGMKKLGDFDTTNPKDYSFLEYGVAPPDCIAGQLKCRNGQCINNGTMRRCNHFLDCNDKSDEDGCNYISPKITLSTHQLKLHPGEDASINCSASGDEPIEIFWSPKNRDITDSVYAKEGYIRFNNIQLEDAGKYLCTAYNGAGKEEAVVDVIVEATTTKVPTTSSFTTKPSVTASPPEKSTTPPATTRKPVTCPSYQFQCIDNYNCISQSLRCNGNNDCSDGSDEYNCPTQPPPPTYPPETTPYDRIDCPYGMQPCRSGDKCARYCDGRAECYDLSDETDCSFNPQKLYLKTYFQDRNKIIGKEVVLTCRDEGPLRANVQWSRANGAPLSPGSSDINGRLTIPNIQLEHAGTYLCSAIDFPTTRVAVVVTVTCPLGYSGTSCEKCSPGFVRQNNGPWLGLCTKEPVRCPPGMYNDGRECQICPCPHTTPGNQFGRSCQLAPNGEVICNCPPEYVGNRCENCAPGYVGNPLVSGDSCRRIPPPRPYCDPAGSIDATPDQYGRCRCKNLVDGPTCNQCKANSFHLNSQNQFGCVSCFCMGVSLQCSSSNWYRSQVSNIFVSSINEFKLVGNVNRETPITEGIRLDSQDRQISYSGFRTSDVYYWSLPSRYQGNKLTSYGGYLRYSLRHKSIPGGQSSRNNAADVELVSKNKINLLYYNRNQTQSNPNGAQTFAVPILEQHWQRIDGQTADREHLLMVLADLEAIYIKATYFTNTQESSLISVSLDIATDQNTGSTQRAVEVEQCHCPVGYTGLSCETCDVGYTRTPSGLYLGMCEPCDCNGYSNECDPDTGICLHCKDGTTGDYCNECLPGYNGDPSNRVPCMYGPTPPYYCKPRVDVSKSYVDVNEGLPVEIQCVGSGVPTPDVSIVRADGQQLNPEQRFENGVFYIRQSRLSDSGDYISIASNRLGTSNARFTIIVREVQGPIVQVNISPSYFTGVTGDNVMLRCSSSTYEQNIKWSKQGGNLPYNSVEDRGNLIIRDASPNDSGVYICTITSTTGTRGYNRATVTITGSQEGRFPTATVSVDRITLNQGASFEVQCNATGVPPPSVQWTRLGGELGRNTKQVGSTLIISDAAVEDRGVYVCVSTNVNGLAQATTVVEVIRLETPRLEIYPSISQTVIAGNSAVLQCRAIAGIPTPTVIWSRENNLPLSANVEEMAGGALRFTQITPLEQGEYICTANNEAGTATATAQIIVHTLPDVKLKPLLKTITRQIGARLKLECEGTGSPLTSVKWIKQDIHTHKSFPLGRQLANNKALITFNHLTKNDEGFYYCEGENSAGIVWRRLQLIVK